MVIKLAVGWVGGGGGVFALREYKVKMSTSINRQPMVQIYRVLGFLLIVRKLWSLQYIRCNYFPSQFVLYIRLSFMLEVPPPPLPASLPATNLQYASAFTRIKYNMYLEPVHVLFFPHAFETIYLTITILGANRGFQKFQPSLVANVAAPSTMCATRKAVRLRPIDDSGQGVHFINGAM